MTRHRPLLGAVSALGLLVTLLAPGGRIGQEETTSATPGAAKRSIAQGVEIGH